MIQHYWLGVKRYVIVWYLCGLSYMLIYLFVCLIGYCFSQRYIGRGGLLAGRPETRLMQTDGLNTQRIHLMVTMQWGFYKASQMYQKFFFWLGAFCCHPYPSLTLAPQSDALSRLAFRGSSYPSIQSKWRFENSKAFYSDLKQTKADPLDESRWKWMKISAVQHAFLRPFLFVMWMFLQI